jgi:hypothetical protein
VKADEIARGGKLHPRVQPSPRAEYFGKEFAEARLLAAVIGWNPEFLIAQRGIHE